MPPDPQYRRFKRQVLNYAPPSFEEVLKLCRDVGLVTACIGNQHRVQLSTINQTFHVTFQEADLIMKGLLLGYYYAHCGNDMDATQWEA